MKSFVKYFTKFLPQKEVRVGRHPMFLPDRDWQVMLIAVIIVNLVVGVFASYMFFQIQGRSFFKQIQTDSRLPAASLQTQTLNDVVEYYEQKRSQHNSFISEPPQTIDPFEG